MKLRSCIALLCFSPDQWSWRANLAKRVLLLDSFSRNVAPTSTVISAYRTELSSRSPEPINLQEVTLEMARFAQPEQAVPFVNFLHERFSGRVSFTCLNHFPPAFHPGSLLSAHRRPAICESLTWAKAWWD